MRVIYRLIPLVLVAGLLVILQPVLPSTLLLHLKSLKVSEDLTVYFLKDAPLAPLLSITAEWSQEVQTSEGAFLPDCKLSGVSKYKKRTGTLISFPLGCAPPVEGVYFLNTCWRVRGLFSIPLQRACTTSVFEYKGLS